MPTISVFVRQQIQQANDALAQQEYVRALDILQQAGIHATPAEREQIEHGAAQVHRAQNEAADPIILQLAAQDNEKHSDLLTAERLIEGLSRILGEKAPPVQRWKERFAVWQSNNEAQSRIAGVKKQLQVLWDSGLVIDATQALQIAEQFRDRYPDFIGGQELVQQAKQLCDTASERENTWLVALRESNFDNVIQWFETAGTRSMKQLPWFVIHDEQFIQEGYAPTRDAIANVYTLARTQQNKMAEANFITARQELSRSPDLAFKRIKIETLERSKHLSFYWIETLERFLKERVEPAIAIREQVNQTLLQVTNSVRYPDPREAWRVVNDLKKQDPHAEHIELAQNTIRPWLEKELANDLNDVETLLENGYYSDARFKATMVRDLIAGDVPSTEIFNRAQKLVEQATEGMKLNEQVATELQRLDVLSERESAQAIKELIRLKEKLGDRQIQFPEIENLEQKIQRTVNVSVAAEPLDGLWEADHKLRVFLCHAKEDKPAVRKLHRRLVNAGVDAWLDETKLLGGYKWDVEIPKAISTCHVFLICLSPRSVDKEGSFQKEIQDALDVAKGKPEGAIFIIPLKLEECRVPWALKGLHWIELFEKRGYERLLDSLRVRAKKVGADLP